MLLEQLAPERALGRDDARFVPGPPGAVFAAIQRIAPEELPRLGRLLYRTRRLLPLDPGRPLYGQLLDRGFSVLGVTPLREVAVGRVARLLHPLAPAPRVKDRREFQAFALPRHLRVVLAFRLAQEKHDDAVGTRVTAALRAWGTDAATDRRMRLGWPLVSALVGSVSRAWLAALEARIAP